MKKAIILFALIVIIPLLGISQTIENIDYISPFNNDIAAIKKGDNWAFINKEGDIVINFRNDLVSTKTDEGTYPIFKNDRCLIIKKKNKISYFGYIDKNGETVIEPQFLNATSFNNEVAIALKLIKENVGKNEILDKNVVYYRYYEVTINPNGNIKSYLTDKGVNVILDKNHLKKPPKIMSYQISDNLIAVKTENSKWIINNINNQ